MKILAPVKLNLFLKVIGKNSQGYHKIYSLVTFVNLYDVLRFNIERPSSLVSPTLPSSNSLTITSTTIATTGLNNANNLVLKLVDYLQQQYNIPQKVTIHLEKNIPIGGGLGGGSSDAAATLLALNKLWGLNLPLATLADIGLKFGADIPVCVYQTSGIMQGIGEVFTPVALPYSLPILLVNPKVEVSTKSVFNSCSITPNFVAPTLKNLIANKAELLKVIKSMGNDLLSSAMKLEPKISTALQTLQETNPLVTNMSGSGTTCFAIYNSWTEASKAQQAIKAKQPNFLVTAVNSL